jgi:alkanesulfonate monooxygenase SsuD/methylene tetrahydromethanopterin reductase-like flavin-dependent oxidoreductase (luciferase family)
MKLNLFAMPTIPATVEERLRERPVGRSTPRYQMMIDELRSLAVMADGLGIDAFSTTEHHFHTEGLEGMPNTIALSIDLAARTKNLKLVPFSIVLPAANPLRVAEDIALLDQFSQGRAGVAFARGYQKRWIQTISQGGAASNAGREADVRNRAVFEENIEIVQKAWSSDAFEYNGAHFQVPFPYDQGVIGCGGLKYIREFGADGEIDDTDTVRKIGTVPAPYKNNHPPIYFPLTVSPATVDYCARKGFTGFLFGSEPAQFRAACERFREVSREHGRSLGLGEHLGAVRSISIAETYDEAFEIAVKSVGNIFQYYFGDFGFFETFRTPADDPNKPVHFKDEYEVTQRFIDLKFLLCGTVDQVKREIAALHDIHGAGGNLEWLQWAFYQQGVVPLDVQRRQIDLFVDKVWSEFR